VSSVFGYARVSSADQDLSLQQAALTAAGCTIIRAEKASGTSRNGRTELETLMEFLRPGDTLVVTRIDRLARSLRDLENIVHELTERGVHLKATEQPIDTSTAAGKAFLSMLGVFAAFETALRHERQMEGIKAAKARGIYKGRKASIKAEDVRRLREEGIGATEIAERLGIDRASVYRVLQP
jgi:DNA invertase Pin-like site-specific DNA recombinase